MEKELVTSDYFVKKLDLDVDNKFVKRLLEAYDNLDNKCKEKSCANIAFYALVDIMDFQYNHTI